MVLLMVSTIGNLKTPGAEGGEKVVFCALSAVVTAHLANVGFF